MSNYANLARTPTPQNEPLDDRQVANHAGGFVYEIDRWERLDRFLILGSDQPTYYQDARALTKENAAVVAECFAVDAVRTAGRIAEISESGRAPKNSPAIFAVAIGAAHTDTPVHSVALSVLRRVCRTASHLFEFVAIVEALGRGWGRSLRTAVAGWYEKSDVDGLAYQAVKYRSREGYNHRRLLMLSHPSDLDDPARKALYVFMLEKSLSPEQEEALPEIVKAHREAMSPEVTGKQLQVLVSDKRLPWEAIPTQASTDPEMWRRMLPSMGLTAMLRKLGQMSSYGVLEPLSDGARVVMGRLGDVEQLRKARIHPFNVLLAQAVYRSGHGVRGSMSWQPTPQIIDALEAAFYASFQTVQPSGKKTLIGLDVSGSMGFNHIGTVLTVREAAAAMSMVTARTEPQYHVFGFSDRFVEIPIAATETLESVVRKTSGLPFQGTDCALPMLYALDKGIEVETFMVFTDNETWAGREHPSEALKRYRQATGIDAKLIVVGMTSTGFSIADPNDPGMLDVVGFDSAAPTVMADFARQ